MPDLSLSSLLNSPVKAVIFYVCIIIVSVFDAVEKIEVEIINAASFELLVKDPVPVLKRVDTPRRKLCRNGEGIPRMALDYRFLYGSFGVAAVINICGVKIIEPRCQIAVCHFADLVDIDDPVCFRKSHKAKTDPGHFVQINAHSNTSCLISLGYT